MTKKTKSGYTDGFVIPIAKKNLNAYRRMALACRKIWIEYGAVDFVECVVDDLVINGMPASFPKQIKLKRGELVLFSWITYKSKTHRDKVNAKVMSDKRMAKMMDRKAMPFDGRRMLYGGFKIIIGG